MNLSLTGKEAATVLFALEFLVANTDDEINSTYRKSNYVRIAEGFLYWQEIEDLLEHAEQQLGMD